MAYKLNPLTGQLDQVGAAAAAASLTKLTSDTTYYVRTDGNDANDGLTNTAGGAFATIAKAMAHMHEIDANGYAVTIQIGDGTWSTFSLAGGTRCIIPITKRPINVSSFKIYGNRTTPANCVLDLYAAAPGLSCVGALASGAIADGFGGFQINGNPTVNGAGTFYGFWSVNLALISGVVSTVVNNVQYGAYCATGSLIAFSSGGVTFSGWTKYPFYLTDRSRINGYAVFAAGANLIGTFGTVDSFSMLSLTGGITGVAGMTIDPASKKYTLTKGSYATPVASYPGNLAGTADATSWTDVVPSFTLIKLTADTTYYVRQDGSDNNNGLANTAAGAFRTIARAMQQMNYIDANKFAVTIQIGDGTWTEKTTNGTALGGSAVIEIEKRPINCTVFSIYGNTTTPANCILDVFTAGATGGIFVLTTNVDNLGGFQVNGNPTRGGASTTGVYATWNANINSLTAMVFNNINNSIYVQRYSRLSMFGSSPAIISGYVDGLILLSFMNVATAHFSFAAGSTLYGTGVTSGYFSYCNVTFYNTGNVTPDAASKQYALTMNTQYHFPVTPPGTIAGTADATCVSF